MTACLAGRCCKNGVCTNSKRCCCTAGKQGTFTPGETCRSVSCQQGSGCSDYVPVCQCEAGGGTVVESCDPCRNVVCGKCQTCVNGVCVSTCSACQECDTSTINGTCRSLCGKCQACIDGKCITTCSACEVCDTSTPSGSCVPKVCGACESCVNGQCVKYGDPCGFPIVTCCTNNQCCVNGVCVSSACPGGCGPCQDCVCGSCIQRVCSPACSACEVCNCVSGSMTCQPDPNNIPTGDCEVWAPGANLSGPPNSTFTGYTEAQCAASMFSAGQPPFFPSIPWSKKVWTCKSPPACCTSGPKTLAFSTLSYVGGPGTELKAMLKLLGFEATDSCPCNARAKTMDENELREPGWCERNIETILDWLKEQADARGLPFIRVGARILVKRAISQAKRKSAQKGNSK